MTKNERLREIVTNSCFYVKDGDWYRIQYTDEEEDKFNCINEDSHDEIEVMFEEIDMTKDKFYELKEVAF